MPQTTPQLMVIDNVLPKAAVAAAYDMFRASPKPFMQPGLFYVGMNEIGGGRAAQQLAAYMPQEVATFVVEHLERLISRVPSAIREAADGLETWNAVLGPGGPACLHVDVDEMIRASTAELRYPTMGTIFHLGPESGLVGGETVFELGQPLGNGRGDPRWAMDSWEKVLARCSAPIVVPQRQNRLILFSGDLPHAVAPIQRHRPGEPRAALLANFWDRRIVSVPDGVASLSAEELAQCDYWPPNVYKRLQSHSAIAPVPAE